MSDEGWQRMLDIHLNGAFFCTRAFVRRLVDAEQGGSMICISSIAGIAGWGPVHYATAKAGLLGLVRSVARFCGTARHPRQRDLPGRDRHADDAGRSRRR